nr:vesicle-associated membrane protein 3 [Callithrix jacchus]
MRCPTLTYPHSPSPVRNAPPLQITSPSASSGSVRRGSCIDLHSAFRNPNRPGTPMALNFPSSFVREAPAHFRRAPRDPANPARSSRPHPVTSLLRAAPPRPSPWQPLDPAALLSRPLLAAAAAVAAAKMSTGPAAAAGSNRRLQQTQNQVDEVVDIMRVNVDKVLERDQKLSELDDRADALQAGASQFETSAAKLKRKYWWKNCKMWAIGITVLVIFIVIIIVWVVSS